MTDAQLASGSPWHAVRASIGSATGSLHRPQQAGGIAEGTFRTEGARRARGWWSAAGAEYVRGRESDVQWRNGSNADVGNPYIWADSVGGTFRSDAIKLDGMLVSPAIKGARAGIGLGYGLGQGARRNDPRPLFRRRIADLSPGVQFAHGAHTIGGGMIVGWTREDLEVGGGLSSDVPVVFRLRGIGTFDRTQLVSGARAVLGGARGATAAYAMRRAGWALSTGIIRRTEHDSVSDGIAQPTSGGSTARTRNDANISVRRTGARYGLDFDASWADEHANGRDPIFQAINARDHGRRTDVRLAGWRGALPIAASWGLHGQYTAAHLEREDLATETHWLVRSRSAGIGVLRAHAVGEAQVRLSLDLQHRWPAADSYVSRRPSRLTPVLAAQDYEVVRAARTDAGGAIAIEHVVPSARRVRVTIASAIASAIAKGSANVSVDIPAGSALHSTASPLAETGPVTSNTFRRTAWRLTLELF